jgi:general secretion pathway protein G
MTMTRQFAVLNFQFSKNRAGFTLIELLVVISILGVLTTLVISNVSGARERARDAQRKSDLKEIQNALELYKQDQSSPAYPEALSSLTSKYIKSLPVDPQTGLDYYYTVKSSDNLDYRLKACLENESDPQGGEDDTDIEAAYGEDSLTVCTSGIKFELGAP